MNMKTSMYLILLVVLVLAACDKKVEESEGISVEVEPFEMPSGHAACVAYYEGVRVACVRAAEGENQFDCASEFDRMEKMQQELGKRLEKGDVEDTVNTEVCQAALTRLAGDPTARAASE